MPAINDMTLPLKEKTYFHIYNRAISNNRLFYKEKNYAYFLKKYAFYMNEYWDTYTYSLPRNHFHLLIKTKSTAETLRDTIRINVHN
ncbi:MAG TPA: hypothetical protein ENK85_02110 [Saprospiraceae bacterium]|nr:hypothetical protein [Saprospiraceae bacterium]